MTGEPMSEERIAEIRARLGAATPGPWAWFGKRSGPIYLSTVAHGRRFVMTFEVTQESEGDEIFRWAQPCFQVYDDKTDEPWTWSGRMTPASKLAVMPRNYRDDIAGIENADADLIANAPADLAALLADRDRLLAALDAAEEPS